MNFASNFVYVGESSSEELDIGGCGALNFGVVRNTCSAAEIDDGIMAAAAREERAKGAHCKFAQKNCYRRCSTSVP